MGIAPPWDGAAEIDSWFVGANRPDGWGVHATSKLEI
jgi:hypothetical protein